MSAQRSDQGGADTFKGKPFAPRALRINDQFEDRHGQGNRRAQIDGALPTAIAITEREIWSTSTSTDRAPGRNDGGLASEQLRPVGNELFYSGDLWVNDI